MINYNLNDVNLIIKHNYYYICILILLPIIVSIACR